MSAMSSPLICRTTFQTNTPPVQESSHCKVLLWSIYQAFGFTERRLVVFAKDLWWLSMSYYVEACFRVAPSSVSYPSCQSPSTHKEKAENRDTVL